MRQVTQRPRDGRILVQDVPAPTLRPGWVLVANRYSLISAGTERSKIELGEKSLLQKARARPDLVRKVVDRARVEGVRSAVGTALERLEALAPLGYSSAGVVARVGEGVVGIAPGDEVACAGGGFANHADVVAVPQNLVARVPAGVDLESAAYATVGAIAMHGIRQADVALGDRVGVIGLGLVGQLAVRLLEAAGCAAFGIDLDPVAVAKAEAAGAHGYPRSLHDLQAVVHEASRGLGLDAVLVCAATSSPDPLRLAAELARDRGRLVVVGDVPVEVDRALLYEKELELRISRSYGPGRYLRDYEEGGRDLPPGYVRWTEQRNLQSFLELLAAQKLEVRSLTTHRFPVELAPDAYAVLTGENLNERPFGIVLEYQHDDVPTAAEVARPMSSPATTGPPRIGLIGAGAFARGTLLPALRAAGAEFATVASERGLSAKDVAGRFSFARAAASSVEVLADEGVDAVVVATRHANHAELVAAALREGKAVFVEKPLALTEAELAEVEASLSQGGPLMVGFNRRFAPLVERLLSELASVASRTVAIRVNAGPLPASHWLHDPNEGGGRLLGEGCHFVDLLAHLAGAPITVAYAAAVPQVDRAIDGSDELVASLRFANGSVGTLLYTGAGDARLPKERIEIFGGGIAAVLDDFRRLELYRGARRSVIKQAQDKGHRAEVARFVDAVAGRAEAPPAATYLNSTRATLALAESLRTGQPAELR
jgi:predicted dehydrogenase